MQLMREKPVVFAQYSRFLLDGLPRLAEAMNRDRDNIPYTHPTPYSQYELKGRKEYALSRVRVPIPGLSNVFLEGLNTPVESLMEEVGVLDDFVQGMGARAAIYANKLEFLNRITGLNLNERARVARLKQEESKTFGWRFASRMNFVTKALIEQHQGHHYFYDMPIEELVNARQIRAALATVEAYPLGLGPLMAETIKDQIGYREIYDPDDNRARAMSTAIYRFGNTPWSRLFSDQAAAMDAFNSSLASDPDKMRAAGLDPGEWDEVDEGLRYLRVLTGLKIISESPYHQRHYDQRGWTDAHEKWMIDYGLIDEEGRTQPAR